MPHRNEVFSEGFRPLWLLLHDAVDEVDGSLRVTLVSNEASIDAANFISRFADTNGDDTGIKIATGDYSAAEEIFFIQPPAGDIYSIHRLIVKIVDTGKFAPDTYGVLPQLPTGIAVRVSNDSGVIVELTNGLLVKTNSDWAAYCYDLTFTNETAGADNYAVVRWTFFTAGVPIILNGDVNERIEIVLNDNFTGLIDHRFMFQGHALD